MLQSGHLIGSHQDNSREVDYQTFEHNQVHFPTYEMFWFRLSNLEYRRISLESQDDVLWMVLGTLVTTHSWVDEFPGAVTVCDPQGIILEMNHKAAQNFAEDGGQKLVGTNMLDCHPEPAKTKLKQLLEKRQMNVYTTEKMGVRKLIYQSPWYKAGEYRGFIELSLVIPIEIPNFIRD
jgi:hypothetical protein